MFVRFEHDGGSLLRISYHTLTDPTAVCANFACNYSLVAMQYA